jgi:hypothetical protein
MSNPRKITIKILDMIDQGIFSKDMIISACLNAMSESDVADMARLNGLFDFEEEVEED